MMIPLPTPVPKVMVMKFFIPLAAPYCISPTAAALASLVNLAGILNFCSRSSAIGIMPFHFRLAAYSIVP